MSGVSSGSRGASRRESLRAAPTGVSRTFTAQRVVAGTPGRGVCQSMCQWDWQFFSPLAAVAGVAVVAAVAGCAAV